MHKICMECGGKMHLTTIERTFNVKGKQITISGIEAYVCDHCNEEVFTSTEAKMIERVISAIRESTQADIPVLNLYETAEFLRVSNQTIYNMIRDGRIKAYKVGREWRFLQSDILAYMNSKVNDDLLAAKGGEVSENDIEIILSEIEKRKKQDE